jgi:hypothetical protein
MLRVGSRIRQEGPHAATSSRLSPPPRSTAQTPPRQLSQLWRALTADNRQHILNALSRVVAEHLSRPPLPREETHERP